MIVIDANVLIAWSAKKTPDLVRARLQYMLETAAKEKERILIPTPALAEFLVRTDDATTEWLAELEKKSAVDVCSFDRKAAFECAFIERGAHKAGDKKHVRTLLTRRSSLTARSSPSPSPEMPGWWSLTMTRCAGLRCQSG